MGISLDYSLNIFFNNWMLIVLIALRFFGVMMICPLFGERVPKIVKMLLALSFSAIMLEYFSPHKLAQFEPIMFVFLMARELVIGYLLGYLFSFPLWMIEGTGNLIDMQRGEQFGSLINPMTKNPSSSISKLIFQGFIVYFITANGFLYLLKLIFTSFIILPAAELNLKFIPNKALFVQFFADYFYWILMLAMPVIFAMLLVDLVLGLLNSFIQQINVTTLGMPIKSMVALIIMVFYLGVLYRVSLNQFGNITWLAFFK